MLPSTEADQCVFVMWNVVCGYSVGLLQILPRRGEHHGGVDQPDRGSLSPEWQQRQLHRYLWLIKHFFTCVITSVRWGFSKYLCERSEKNEQGIWGKNRLKMKQERFIWAEELLTQQNCWPGKLTATNYWLWFASSGIVIMGDTCQPRLQLTFQRSGWPTADPW